MPIAWLKSKKKAAKKTWNTQPNFNSQKNVSKIIKLVKHLGGEKEGENWSSFPGV